MAHKIHAEAERLTKETGFYHFADVNDLTHQYQIFKTPFREGEGFAPKAKPDGED